MVAPLLLLVLARQLPTPSDTVRQYIAAWNAHDGATLCALTLGGTLNSLAQIPVKDLPSIEVKDLQESVAGDDATVSLTVTFGSNGESKTQKETDKLKRVSGKWLVVPAAKSDKDPGALSIIATIIANPHEAFAGAKSAAQATACLSNIKQIALACFIYCNDYDDKFMPKGADIHKALYPYLKNRSVWICPTTGKPAYSFNSHLLGTLSTKVKNPAATVMFYEGANNKLDFVHDGKATVAFADGHAKFIDKAAAGKLVWKP